MVDGQMVDRDTAAEVRFGLLGPVLASYGGLAVGVGSARQRVLLAALLLRPNRAVAELQALTELVGSGGPATTVIAAISGMAGAGKTALAVHWAHRAAPLFRTGSCRWTCAASIPRGRP